MSNILLIEPNRVLGRTHHQALEQAGHHVQTCATAQSAIMAADEINPDIVILEMQLVQHSGAEFLYEFRSYPDWHNVPVILYTQVPPTQFHETFQATCRQLGVSEYLYKPTTSLQTLLASVQQALAVRA